MQRILTETKVKAPSPRKEDKKGNSILFSSAVSDNLNTDYGLRIVTGLS